MHIAGCNNCDGIRREPDGTIWLTKANKEAEAFFDRTMLRTRPQDLRWKPIPRGEKIVLSSGQMHGIHEGMIGLMLGKGPSLDAFLAEYQKSRWHVVPIGINEAATKFPCKYAFALDDTPLRAITQRRDENVIGVVEPRNLEQPFTRLMVFEWGKHATPGYETAPVALEICSGVFGIKTFVMVGFDGYDSGRDEYAPSLQLEKRRGDGNYSVINRHIDEVALVRNLRLVWWHRGGGAHRLEGQQHLRSPRATSLSEQPSS